MPLIAPPAAVHAAQHTFRTLLNGMARPGAVYQLALAPDTTPEFAVCMTLLDFEVTYVSTTDETRAARHMEALDQRIALEIGCQQSSFAEATFVVSYGALPAAAWPVLRRGTLAYPDRGATIIYVVDAIGAATRGDPSASLALSGPGIESERYLTVGGLAASEFQRFAATNRDYPMGIDAILLDPQGRVACLPRSCTIIAREPGDEGT
ncbi:MAG: phosphonate C-P lyase system protein PhnH [Chloroflexota bacterium]|nr:phosphonate C-P lyase system protein PhnH [Chloroflexota bacterium]